VSEYEAFGLTIPAEDMRRYSTESDGFSADDIRSYVHGQARDETVLHLERIKTEVISHVVYDVWDVITDVNRWWVITNFTNLYSQKHFPSLDSTLSFHIGLMMRLRESSPKADDPFAEQFGQIFRRQEDTMSALDLAVEAEDFQKIGLSLREQLMTLSGSLSEFVVLREDIDKPKKGDFKAVSAALYSSLLPGRRNQALRKFLISSAEDAWELVNWLTHDRDAAKSSSLIAAQAVDALIGHTLFAFKGDGPKSYGICPVCTSRRIRQHFDINIGEDGEYFSSCAACSWTDHPSQP
jgi:hypothetical protein